MADPTPVEPALAAPAAARPPAPSAEDIDLAFRAALGKLTGGLSPTAFGTAWADWALNLAASPARLFELQKAALERAGDQLEFAARAASGAPLAPDDGAAPDPRFAAPAWQQYPFNVIAHGFQNAAAFMKELPKGVAGLEPYHAELVEFTVRQWLDALAPSNFLPTNPELQELTRAEGGENLMRGAQHLIEDLSRTLQKRGPAGSEAFVPGKGTALSPGTVVFRNALIVPAWIMKYYILDLSPKNSMVKFLVEQGHTVFMISWKNPEPADRDFTMG